MLAPPCVPMTLDDLRALVSTFALSFDPRVLDAAAAARALGAWSAIAHAAEAAIALTAARIAASGAPVAAGARDVADYVAKHTGTSAAKARATIAHGERLDSCDATRAAAAAGRLSAEQAAAITDAAIVNPAAEAGLLDDAAHSSLGTLRDACAAKKAAVLDLEEIECRVHARRCVRRWRDAEGAEHLHATGPKAAFAIIDQALRREVDDVFGNKRAEGSREPVEAYAFDALASLAAKSLDGGSSAVAPSRRRRNPIRSLAVLRLDVAALARGRIHDGEACEIAGLGPVSVATARAMLGESILKLVLTDGVAVRNVTHLGHGPTAAQRIALLWEQPTCAREGCGRRGRLEYDHIDSYEFRRTRHTRLDELSPLCEADHDLKTQHGWALVEGTGVRPMVPPDDPRHPRHARAARDRGGGP